MAAPANATFLPTRAGVGGDTRATCEHWMHKHGEERVRYLLQMMGEWTQHYTHGVLIDFEFTKPLQLDGQVKPICTHRGWQFEQVRGDLGLLHRWVDGPWDAKDFLVVQPSEKVAPSYDEEIIEASREVAANLYQQRLEE